MDKTNLNVNLQDLNITLQTNDSSRTITLEDNSKHNNSWKGARLTDIILPFPTRADFPKSGSQEFLYLDYSTGDMFTYGYVSNEYTSVSLANGDIIMGGGASAFESGGEKDGKDE